MKIYNTQLNNYCRLCGERDETINPTVSECIKLSQKDYKSRNNWVGKMIHWKLCKSLNFNDSTKWYMLKKEFLQEDETHMVLRDFEI